MQGLSIGGFFLRWMFAVLLVLATFNPTPYCYVKWLLNTSSSEDLPIKFLVGVVLVTIFAVYYHATKISLGTWGVTLTLLIFGGVIWQMKQWGWLDPAEPTVMGWLALVILATIMALGMSWSHIQRRLTGQLDVEMED